MKMMALEYFFKKYSAMGGDQLLRSQQAIAAAQDYVRRTGCHYVIVR